MERSYDEEELLRKYEDGSKAKEYYHDLELQKLRLMEEEKEIEQAKYRRERELIQ